MKYLIFFLLLSTNFSFSLSQNVFKARILDDEEKPLFGANVMVMNTNNGSSSAINGFVEIRNIPNGKQQINITYIGYKDKQIFLEFPMLSNKPIHILLHPKTEEMDQIIVTSLRSSRTIIDTPTRIEAISGEELDEKANMKPGSIRMLLYESTGIQTQQTSAVSFNSSIRIQGLDGKYTQILKDGFPLYGNFSGGLSLLQIPPLDLQQVEVIKGASSTLYGGDAIAGMVNLISKKPTDRKQLKFLLNSTSAKGLDASCFYAKKHNIFGTTMFLAYNLGSAYDPNNIGFTALPKFSRVTFNPKLYYYFNKLITINFGVNGTFEDRIGGDVDYILGDKSNSSSYFENNITKRISTQIGYEHKIDENVKLSAKNIVSYYDRVIEIPGHKFGGKQLSTFTEIYSSKKKQNFHWVTGLSIWSDRFTQDFPLEDNVLDYLHTAFGGFAQNTWFASNKISLETGLRIDHQNEYGNFVLPRFAVLMKATPKLAIRFGIGEGYKTPTTFTEDAEKVHFKNIKPIDPSTSSAEESVGINVDVNYRTTFWDEATFSINTLLFHTKINKPMHFSFDESEESYTFNQSSGFISTSGIETNIKLTYNHFKLFIGYTFADVQHHLNGNISEAPLVAKHRLNNVLIYEVHDNVRIGLEGYYYGKQKLEDNSFSEDYWIFGLMIEKYWDKFSLFLNFENFTDTRQTKFGDIYSGSISEPTFLDIWAPLDGFVINGGIKINL